MQNLNAKTSKLPTNEQMQAIYEAIKTPNKLGAVMKFEDCFCDSPTIFYKDGMWYMVFIKISKCTEESGYDTHIAKSPNLINWEYMYPILKRSKEGSWDSAQVAGYIAFQDTEFGGSNELHKIGGKYYLAYLGGGINGYETDPLMTGLCKAENIVDPETIVRLPEPILRPDDEDSRPGETLTLYKHCMFIDEEMTLGHRYVTAYNAKDSTQHESIFLAVSDDAEHWQRYGDTAIIDDKGVQINGDPQIVKIGDLYVMFYFIFKGGEAYNTFACSYNLVDWRVWDGAPLIKGEYEWENIFAHKNWVIKTAGKVYHFYCAVNKQNERFIALATS